MLSESQVKEIEERSLKTARAFLENDTMTIDELTEILKSSGVKTSSSTVQRDLNSGFVQMTLGKETMSKIKEKLIQNKEKGVRTGGINSMKNNEFIKGIDGKFKGSRSK